MDANVLVAKLKANGTENDLRDLAKVIEKHKKILSTLSTKDRGSFCLNVLCILCRNIDKVPSWRENIDPKLLLTLSIDCVTETRAMEMQDRVKTLACIYHIHRFIVRLKSPIPPELVLKISIMPFECDVKQMLSEYAKTYWSILVDRITFIEMLKAGKVAIGKLLPKVTEDILKVIQIYNTAQFCINGLTFLIKKLHFLYNDRCSVELNKVFGQIFESFTTKKDLKSFMKLSYKEQMDLYVKFNDCFYVIVENSSKNHFDNSILTNIVLTFVSLLGHNSEIYHCFQTFYSNTFCKLFTNMPKPSARPASRAGVTSDATAKSNYNEIIFNYLLVSCEKTEKLGYSKIMRMTYPFLNQLLRLYIDYSLANVKDWNEIFTENSQEYYLRIILLIMKESKHTEQFLKCDDCEVKSGLHDALRLSFVSIHFLKRSENIDNILPLFTTIIEEQHTILLELKKLGCKNHERCYRKLQTDIHNTAIVLNKSKKYDFSIKLFNIYLEHEIRNIKDDSDLKNISRAFYNKSICELDCQKYEDALHNAFLSLGYSCPEGFNSDKYMSLVMDIKAKALKSCGEDDSPNSLQLVSVLDVCNMSVENKWYRDLKPFFGDLLRHEFSMYAKLWPSILPIAGVWRALHRLVNNKSEDEDKFIHILFDVILETSAVVRSIYNDYYKDIVGDLVAKFDEKPATNTDLQVVQAAMLFLKAEFDLHDAAEKYQWKITDPSMDPDEIRVTRTVSQEHEATRRAIQAVDLLTDILPNITTVAVSRRLILALEIAGIFVPQLLHLSRQTHGLQLAYICCVLAEHVGDRSSYVRNAGVLLSHSHTVTDKLCDIAMTARKHSIELLAYENSVDTGVVFICDTAINKIRIGDIAKASKLIQIAHSLILEAYEKYPNGNMDLSVGRLLEAQSMLYIDSPSKLSAVSEAQKHYLAMRNTTCTRHPRRLHSQTAKYLAGESSALAVRGARALLLRRRARVWCAAAAGAGALIVARLHAATEDADAVKIDNRLKYILGMPTNEAYNNLIKEPKKQEIFTPKQDIEVMLENVTFKQTQVSPSVPCVTIPGFKTPEFFKHTKCDCYACEIPECYILSACIIGLEAIMYFRANETDIAANYFDGAFKCFQLAERRLMKLDIQKCEKFIVETVKKNLTNELKIFEVQILIEAACFELSLGNYEKVDGMIIRLYEMCKEYDVDQYLKNDATNLIVSSFNLRRHNQKKSFTEMEVLTLSPPDREVAPPKTPEIKARTPPKIPKVTVNYEQLPVKRKVIKLNLDEVADEDEKAPKKISEFKIPAPVSKHVLENITPINTRSKSKIFVTQASDDAKTPMNELSTPVAPSPEEFFTPMSTLRTYTKKSLRHNLVKNLEAEFSTPKGDKSGNKTLQVPKNRVKVKGNKEMLKRATSPGKLVKETPTNSSRKLPKNFSDKME